MTELALRILIVVFTLAAPLWLVLHAIVLSRIKKPILYFELQQLGRHGDQLASLAFKAWNAAICAALGIFLIGVVRFFQP
jgi:hypothetical protein